MSVYTEEATRATNQALMLAFAEEYGQEQDEHMFHPTSPFDQDGECWNDFWATYAETME